MVYGFRSGPKLIFLQGHRGSGAEEVWLIGADLRSESVGQVQRRVGGHRCLGANETTTETTTITMSVCKDKYDNLTRFVNQCDKYIWSSSYM